MDIQLAFIPLDTLPVIKTEQNVECQSLGRFEVSEESFLILKRKIESVIRDEYYYIALKYSKRESLTSSEAKEYYNEFVNKYNSLISI